MTGRASEPAWCALPRRLADPRGLEVPSSHRGGWKGLAITRAKQLMLRGVLPLQHVLLESQSRLNAALVEGLASLPEGLGAEPRELASLLEGVGAEPRELLGVPPVVAAVEWGVLGRTWMERQRAWNRLAVEALLEASSVWPRCTASLAEKCGALAASADVFEEGARDGWHRALRPAWRELWRRQVAFHHAFTEALRWAVGIARPRMHLPSPEEYEAWWRAREREEVRVATEALASLRHRPLISLVMPAWRTPEPLLRACLDSVLAQVYPDWELCIVDDGSPDEGVARVVGEYARRDARIRFERLPRNGGIARATNAAIASARGALIAFLDHDDTLAPHALAEVALHAQAHPDADVFYSDEDKLDGAGRRSAPYLKPALSPDLLRALNYVCHFVAVRAPLLREVGGLREGFDGAQDHELLLRLLERTPRFVHIPRVLYHWRVHPGSTSLDAGAKPAASDAGRRAVEEHLARLGTPGDVGVVLPGVYRVRYPLRGRPRVSVILHGRTADASSRRATRALLASLSGTDKTGGRVDRAEGTPADETALSGPLTGADVDVLVVHPAPGDEVLATDDGRVRLLPPTERREELAATFNAAAREARGELLLFLAQGWVPAEEDWLEELASQALRPELGAVGPLLLGADGTVEAAGLVLGGEEGVAPLFAGVPDPSLTAFGGSRWPRNLSAVSATCLMVRREAFERLGGFGEGLPDDGSAVDLCLRLGAAGLRTLLTPHARLVRLAREAPARPSPETASPRERLLPTLPREDPYSHPHLFWVRRRAS